MNTVAQRLHESVAAVAPIRGVSLGTVGDSGSVSIQFDPSATGPQQTAAQTAVATFDWSQAAHDAWTLERSTKTIGTFSVVRKGADESNNTVSFADVAGLSFILAPNTHYRFRFVGAYTAAAATTGLQLGVNGPASPVFMRLVGQISTSATAGQNGAVGAYDTAIAATASGGSTALPFWIEGTISTGATGGTFRLRFRSEIAGSAVTILRGSFAEIAAVA
jgi:hypothetical protein